MPELPEVEVLVRHLRPLLRRKTIRTVQVMRPKVLRPTAPRQFARKLQGAEFIDLSRRGKYLLFKLRAVAAPRPALTLLGHLGMTGRMYLLPATVPLPKHAAVVLGLGRLNLVFEDTRYFGRLTLDCGGLEQLGPEPLDGEFTPEGLWQALRASRQPIKIRLLDQSVVAGVGNIYASEALFCAGIPPLAPARSLQQLQVRRLWRAIRQVLSEAVAWGSTVPLSFSGKCRQDRLFYFGRRPGATDYYEERLCVYDRAGRPCAKCGSAIKRLVQAGRSTYYCPRCQPTNSKSGG